MMTEGNRTLESGMLTGGTEWTGERKVDWGNRELESGILTGGTERTGERYVDWMNTMDYRAEL
jgi:hypothetical protein